MENELIKNLDKDIKQKMAKYYWDIEEVAKYLGENIKKIHDVDYNYLYIEEDDGFYKIDVEGNKEKDEDIL